MDIEVIWKDEHKLYDSTWAQVQIPLKNPKDHMSVFMHVYDLPDQEFAALIYATQYVYHTADDQIELYRETLRGMTMPEVKEMLADFARTLIPVLMSVVKNGAVDERMFMQYIRPLLPMPKESNRCQVFGERQK